MEPNKRFSSFMDVFSILLAWSLFGMFMYSVFTYGKGYSPQHEVPFVSKFTEER